MPVTCSDVPTLTHKAGTLNHSAKAARVFFGRASALTLCSLKHVALTPRCTDAAGVLSRFRHEMFMTFIQRQETHFQSLCMARQQTVDMESGESLDQTGFRYDHM